MFEWRKKPLRKTEPYLSESAPEWANFRSVYWFGSEAVNHITKTKSLAEVNQFSVTSHKLYIDVDTDSGITIVEQKLAQLGCGYSKWSTGNRGAHFHVDIESMEGVDVPHSQLVFIKSLGLEKIVDTSIYRHHSCIRCPGAIHSKTGKIKNLIKTVEGNQLNIPTVKYEPEDHYRNHRAGGPEQWVQFKKNIMQERGPGGRHQHLYIIYQSGINAGLSTTDILNWMIWWNANQSNPHTDEAVILKWRSFNAQQKKKENRQSNKALQQRSL